jgi:hypothetical protein
MRDEAFWSPKLDAFKTTPGTDRRAIADKDCPRRTPHRSMRVPKGA